MGIERQRWGVQRAKEPRLLSACPLAHTRIRDWSSGTAGRNWPLDGGFHKTEKQEMAELRMPPQYFYHSKPLQRVQRS